MNLVATPLDGLLVAEPARAEDERGFFARTFDVEALWPVAQMSTSFNRARGTLRGLHFQRAPHGERKLVRCTRGAVWDVAVELASGRWHAEELTAENGRALVVPAGFAHGFLTLTDDAEVLYAMDVAYVPQAADGVRWDDPAFAIAWPDAPVTMSEKDAGWPLRGERA